MRYSNSPSAAHESHKCRHFKVSEQTELLSFLLSKLSGQSTKSVKQLLSHGCVWVNEKQVTQYNCEITAGDDVAIYSTGERRFGLTHPKLRILYEDTAIIVVEKDSGLHSVDTTGGGCENVASLLELYIRRRSPNHRIYVVHRLDRDTSGILVFAKTREAQNQLVHNWSTCVLERSYIAIIEGKLDDSSGTIESYLYEDDHKVVHSTQDFRLGLKAITHYETLESNDHWTRLKLDLETGRTNQIRVHLQSLGHPIIGDEKYGSPVDPLGRLGLHATSLKFYHPVTRRMMSFSTSEPECFEALFR